MASTTSTTRRPAGSTAVILGSAPLRGLAAAGVLISAAVHLLLWGDGFADIAVIGPLFLLNAVGGLAIGLAVLFWRHWLGLLGAIGFGVASIVALLWSAAFGLFGVQEPLAAMPQLVSLVTEAVAAVFAAAAWRLERGPAAGTESRA